MLKVKRKCGVFYRYFCILERLETMVLKTTALFYYARHFSYLIV